MADILIGLQYGDEGKGKITDLLSEEADLVVRFQGGANAGHTIIVGDQTFKLHLIPSGIVQDKMCLIGNGCVVDLDKLISEIKALEKMSYHPSLASTVRPQSTIIISIGPPVH